ncbi:unnamed protein product [Bathycoccus prasinos]
MNAVSVLINQRVQFSRLASTSSSESSSSPRRSSFTEPFAATQRRTSANVRSNRARIPSNRFPTAAVTRSHGETIQTTRRTRKHHQTTRSFHHDRAEKTAVVTRASAATTGGGATAHTIPGLSSMKKADLVRHCEERGLDASGTVPVLRQRLRDAVSSSSSSQPFVEVVAEEESETLIVAAAVVADDVETDDGDTTESYYVKETFSIKDEADDEEQDAIARRLALELAVEADNTRAKDIRVLQVSKAVFYARYVVLATAFNRPQMSAVTSKMRDVANNETYNLQVPKNVANQGDWTCLDCRDVVAHVFTPTARTYYDLEDLYRECDEVELPFETERMHDGFYAEEDQEFYEDEEEDESEDLEDEFEINWSEK